MFVLSMHCDPPLAKEEGDIFFGTNRLIVTPPPVKEEGKVFVTNQLILTPPLVKEGDVFSTNQFSVYTLYGRGIFSLSKGPPRSGKGESY